MVRKERLELSRVAPLEPKSSASTSSATFAYTFLNSPTRTLALLRAITSALEVHI